MENFTQQNLPPLPPPPPINLFNLNPPEIKDYSYILFYQKKHLDMINGIAEYCKYLIIKLQVKRKSKPNVKLSLRNLNRLKFSLNQVSVLLNLVGEKK